MVLFVPTRIAFGGRRYASEYREGRVIAALI